MSVVLFEAMAEEVEELPLDLKDKVVVERRTLNAALVERPDCVLALIAAESRLGTPELDRLPRLKAVLSRSVGLDHIDLGACSARGISVDGVPDYCTNAVAEFAVMLLLHLARGRQVVDAGFTGFGTELGGRTAGVIGGGRIGRRVAAALEGLGCRVLVNDVRPVEGFEQADLDRILNEASVITLHVPGEVGVILGRAELSRVRGDLLFVNTARPALVDSEALLESLAEGRIAAAALDVGPWEVDPGWLERPDVRSLQTAGSLVITRHVAWLTKGAFDRSMTAAIAAIRRWAD